MAGFFSYKFKKRILISQNRRERYDVPFLSDFPVGSLPFMLFLMATLNCNTLTLIP